MNYGRFDKELRDGRVWRAREILQGRLRDARYDPELFGRYARVLQSMGDLDEAGRYFLLSGDASGDARGLVEAFLKRRARWSVASLWETMPRAAWRTGPEGLPKQTMDDLATLDGHRNVADVIAALQGRQTLGLQTKPTARLAQALGRSRQVLRAEFGGVALIVVLALTFLVGAITILSWATRLLGLR